MANKTTNQSKTVLITGATSGIGYELAKLFAKDEYSLVIVSRSEENAQKISDEMMGYGARGVIALEKDLSQMGAGEEIYNELKAQGIEIDVLVNDAGIGQHGKFVENDLQRYMDIIHVNVVAFTALTHSFLKDMVTRGNGKILQLASIASYQPTPLLNVYAATKAYVLSLTDALINELKDTGVTMTALIPGPTDTDFFRKADMLDTKATEDLEDASIVAKIGYEALMDGKHHGVAPGITRQIVMSSLFPNEVVAQQAHKQMEPVEK
jgi:short-subunit dehydrogenase